MALPLAATETSPFDAIRRTDELGEFWTGRDLMPLMEYGRWDAFVAIAEKAKASLALVQGAEAASSNFLHMKKAGAGRGPAATDYRLTRFGAYLVAMAGDDTKLAVAQARVYFAVKTREAETRQDINPRHQLPQSFADALQLAADQARAIERQIAEIAQRDRELAAVTPKAQAFEAIEGGDGVTLRAFHKKYLSDITETDFFEHLYAKGYLIDQRGKGGWSERRQCNREGSQHRHPGYKGKPFLYLHTTVDRGETRRENARVRPGDPELAFRDRLARDGLPVNSSTDVAVRTPFIPKQRS
jgi:hypothetical protein